MAIDRICGNLWPPEFVRRFPEEVTAADEELGLALLGGRARREDDLAEARKLGGSLPLMWAAPWRRMADGRTGIDAARRSPKLHAPVLSAALDRLAAARGVYAEIVRIDPRRQSVLMRDLFDGSRYMVTADRALMRGAVRWLRVFGVLVEVGDGTWSFSSVMAGSGANDDVAPGELVEETRAAIEACGGDPAEVDPGAPHEGLRRWAAVAHGALLRLAAAKAEKKPRRGVFAVNQEGERVEHHEAVVTLRETGASLLRQQARAADDFLETKPDQYSWITGSPGEVFAQGESLGEIGREHGVWTMTASSPGRFERFLRRIEELAGERPKVSRLRVVRPWEGASPSPSTRAKGRTGLS